MLFRSENDNTVKRYKKEIDSTREFAITKFAKDLLDVRDNLQMGYDFSEKVKLDGIKDVEELKRHFVEVKKGMNMTQHVMDACLKRFGVAQFEWTQTSSDGDELARQRFVLKPKTQEAEKR